MKSLLLLTTDDDSIINGGETMQAPSHKSFTTDDREIRSLDTINPRDVNWGSLVTSLFVYLALFFVAYLILIRPHKKRQEKIAEMQSNLKPGDDIITASGLHGKVIEINDDILTVEFGLNKSVRIPVSKQYVYAANDTEEHNQIEK